MTYPNFSLKVDMLLFCNQQLLIYSEILKLRQFSLMQKKFLSVLHFLIHCKKVMETGSPITKQIMEIMPFKDAYKYKVPVPGAYS